MWHYQRWKKMQERQDKKGRMIIFKGEHCLESEIYMLGILKCIYNVVINFKKFESDIYK